MSIASAIMRLASIGLTEEQARVVGDVITEIQLASEAAIESRRASDRARKDRQRHVKSRDGTGQDVTARDGTGQNPPDPPARVLCGAEEVITTSLRSVAADAAPSEQIFENAKQELWAQGKELLAELGVSKAKSGTMIGRWLKETGDDCPAVLDAIRRAREHKPVDPIAWIVRALPPPPRAGPHLNGSHISRPLKTNLFIQAAIESQEDADRERQARSFDPSER